MLQRAVAEIKRRRPAIPWEVPIRVHFACDDRLLYGCRFCILRYGLKQGDHSRLFRSEAEALTHIQSHGEAPAAPGQVERASRARNG
jgi:hypothetical protein